MTGMLEELRQTLQEIEDARALIVCHPDDEASIRLAVDAIAVIAPRIEVNRYATPGQALVFPDPSAFRTIIP
jgi:hypothetical protein